MRTNYEVKEIEIEEISFSKKKISKTAIFNDMAKVVENIGKHYFKKYAPYMTNMNQESDFIQNALMIANETLNDENLITNGLFLSQIYKRVNLQLQYKLIELAIKDIPAVSSRTVFRNLMEIEKRLNSCLSVSREEAIKEELQRLGMTPSESNVRRYSLMACSLGKQASLDRTIISKDENRTITLMDEIADIPDEETKFSNLAEEIVNYIDQNIMPREEAFELAEKRYKGKKFYNLIKAVKERFGDFCNANIEFSSYPSVAYKHFSYPTDCKKGRAITASIYRSLVRSR